MTIGEGAAAVGPEQRFRDNYRKLASLPTSITVTHLLSEDQWVTCNLLLSQKATEAEVAVQVGIDRSVIIMVRGARRCLEKYGSDPEQLRKCFDEAEPD